ncbi:pyridoxamine 5'-phosphate oxidase family protein [Lentzea sp. BCCO 10_0856]|uniref:Pyridoxamine 5'-phosphate oxidase family protein n=1 Tax=Lentzea miocenica TaxID=3095431 RepID=A0ABU4T433_9PSEU|nr:pyridoxamine 5'-phosphate oxidase family protein [Lentzea sp. BCCO 10_0856]MDX8032916.1 pyridoxamine 5'-phosphate oxidase family protein [Lentzea sp. BCCO 10_0856]
MTNTTIETRNLDQYGCPALEWARAQELLATESAAKDVPFFLNTVRPDGRPHSVGIGAAWFEDTLWFVSGPGTRKSRNLAANPACTVSVRLTGLDLVLEGTAHRVTEESTLDRVAARYRSGGWAAEREGAAFTAPYTAPSGGPPPWYVYRISLTAAHAVATAEPSGATRWTFG